MNPLSTTDPTVTARLAILEVAVELIRLDYRLFEITQILPCCGDLDNMVEHRIPHDAAAQLDGILRCVKQDLLQEATSALLKVAQVTATDLRRWFMEEQSHNTDREKS